MWLILLKKFWYVIPLVLLSLLAYHNFEASQYWQKTAENTAELRKADRAAYQVAQIQAMKDNKAEVKKAEDFWKSDAEHAKAMYEIRTKDAYRSVADYAKRMLDTPQGTSSGDGLPTATRPTEGVDGPGEGALVPTPVGDLNVGAENTMKAKQWQEFWADVVAHQPKNGEHK